MPPNEEERVIDEREHSEKSTTNVWDFGIEVVRTFRILVSSGQTWTAFAFLLLIGFYFKIDEKTTNHVIKTVFNILANDRFYLLPLIGGYCILIPIYHHRKKVDKAEIDRLTEERSMLMHGRDKGELKPLKRHTSSEDYKKGDEK